MCIASEAEAREKLEAECSRISESCQYTSTIMYMWLRDKRRIRGTFIVVPLVLAAIGSWSILTSLESLQGRLVTSAATMLAGLLPSIYSALKFDDNVNDSDSAATIYKRLEVKFKQLPILNANKPLAQLESEFRELMEEYEEAVGLSVTPPERYFKKAQKKIQAGHYEPDEKS